MNKEIRRQMEVLTPEGVVDFLAGPHVDGIGPVFARRLVERFGTDTVRILIEEPKLASAIPGLGAARVAAARDSLINMPFGPELPAFLASCGVSEVYIDRIIRKYGKRAVETVADDPYGLVENVWQLSFNIAEKIGHAMGIAADDPRRLRGALLTALKRYAENGHLFATPDEAVVAAASIAGVEPEKISEQIGPLVESGRAVLSRGGLYLPVFYKAEKEGAVKLLELASCQSDAVTPDEIPQYAREGQCYTAEQRAAIKTALESPVMVLTGGPGSGKTTVLRGIIDVLEQHDKNVVLAAPTGRAAKRMTAMTGVEATTIHRLLGFRQGEGYRKRSIDTDVLIIDEGSMMEQVLFNHLLQALHQGTKIIIVGDVDQLPAIGAGDVLRDLIESGAIPVVYLEENFRQAKGSGIAAAATAINRGLQPETSKDFIIIEEPSAKSIRDRILSLISDRLPSEIDVAPADIRVVTPQQVGFLGVRQLNTDLQKRINPTGPEIRRGITIFRVGDPVMQISNSRERGLYNGETGQITGIDSDADTLDVTFSNGRVSRYNRSELSELTLAYAITVHKLQGSEIPYMVMPVTMIHKPMLYRNLLYTAVSRARKLCVIVCEPDSLLYTISNIPSRRRNSNFRHRLHPSSVSASKML